MSSAAPFLLGEEVLDDQEALPPIDVELPVADVPVLSSQQMIYSRPPAGTSPGTGSEQTT